MAEYKDGRRIHAALRTIIEGLSDADTRNVAAYFASLPPIDAASRQNVQLFSPYETGKKLAVACGQCHGADGNSKMPGTPSLAGQQPRYFATAIHEYLNGSRGTPSPMHMLVRDMRAVDVDSVALYFASQTPAQRPPADFGNPAQGEPHTVLCTGCHGLLGVSDDPQTPSLAGQDPEYLVNAIKAYRNVRKYEPMIRVVAGLTDTDVDNIAAFYTIQKGKPADERPGADPGADGEMQSVSRRGSPQFGCGDPEIERAGHGLSGHGAEVVSRQPAPDLGDAQYGPALRRRRHRGPGVLLCEPTGKIERITVKLNRAPKSVIAGLDPAIHAATTPARTCRELSIAASRYGCAGQARA